MHDDEGPCRLTDVPDFGPVPGLLTMFARRDAGGPPDLVPWAGEFVGKYLISGVQAMRMSDDPQLKETLQAIVGRLVQLQAEDGYLGPWPKNERLRGHWDLWGHYHVMLGLMLWHEQTGDPEAARVVRRSSSRGSRRAGYSVPLVSPSKQIAGIMPWA